MATNRTFDYEEGRNDFRFVVTVSDGGDPVRSTTATLHLTITDINDNQPRFDRRVYHVTVPEDVPVGTSVGRVNATDDDVTPRFGHVTYALSLLSDSFKVCSAMESGFDFFKICYNNSSAEVEDCPDIPVQSSCWEIGTVCQHPSRPQHKTESFCRLLKTRFLI